MWEKVEGWQGIEHGERIAMVLGGVCMGIRRLEVWWKGCDRGSSIKLVKWVPQSGVSNRRRAPECGYMYHRLTEPYWPHMYM